MFQQCSARPQAMVSCEPFWTKTFPVPLFTSISIALFQYHRTLNLTGIAGTVFGFICILIANDWQWTGPLPGRSSELVGAPIHESARAVPGRFI